MCLTIPKKVIEIRESSVVVQDHNGDRQELKSLVELAIGDFVLSQQNMVIEKMESGLAKDILKLLQNERS